MRKTSMTTSTGPGRFVSYTRRINVWDIFTAISFVVAAFYLTSFIIRYPEYWFAATLFMIIVVVGLVRRIASIVAARRAPEADAVAGESDNEHDALTIDQEGGTR